MRLRQLSAVLLLGVVVLAQGCCCGARRCGYRPLFPRRCCAPACCEPCCCGPVSCCHPGDVVAGPGTLPPPLAGPPGPPAPLPMPSRVR